MFDVLSRIANDSRSNPMPNSGGGFFYKQMKGSNNVLSSLQADWASPGEKPYA
jgi:hypothetical protein